MKGLIFLVKIIRRILTGIDQTADDLVMTTERNYDDVYCNMQWRHHFLQSTVQRVQQLKTYSIISGKNIERSFGHSLPKMVRGCQISGKGERGENAIHTNRDYQVE